jgi:3-oxochol-4-en-24-oyl-CoA dehydrogenase
LHITILFHIVTQSSRYRTIDTAPDTLALIADVAAAFARPDPARVRDLRDEGGHLDRAMWRRLADNGWLGTLVPEELGGAGLAVDAVVLIARALGRAGFPEPFVAGGVLSPVLLAAAPDAADDPRLAAVLAGETVVGTGWQTEGVTVADGALSGTSRFIGLAGADAYIVGAHGPAGTELHWVQSDASGLTVTGEPHADGTLGAVLELRGVATAPLIGAAGAAAALEDALEVARLALAAELLGLIDATVDMTIDYLGQRRQFGRPIGSFQVLQHRTVDAWIQRELAAAALEAAVAAQLDPDRTPNARAAATSAAVARAAISARAVTRTAVQLHGAIGFTDEYDLGLYVNRALTLAPWLGGPSEHTRRFAELSVEPDAPVDAAPASADSEPPDGDWNALSDEEFRAIVRADIEAHYPSELRFAAHRLLWSEQAQWIAHLLERGWIAPGWPRDRGGMGLSSLKQIIFWEEHERWGAMLYREHGVVQVGPVLMKYGTAEQQERWLPPTLRAEHHWAQGYSEPEAGSDLASLRTRAVRDGDVYIVNGQKIWTTLAHAATHIYFLARTDPEAKPQRGISFFLADITTPGITVRPIRDIAGHEELCEVFFDNVRVPVENRVGAENEGWTIAKSLLGHERITLGSPGPAEYGLHVLETVAAAAGVAGDPVHLRRLAELRLDVASLHDAYARYKAMVARGEEIGPDVSMLKILATETFQAIAEEIIATAGPAGGTAGRDVRLADGTVDVLTSFYRALPMSIYGGSNEIQRNIIATAVLGLPRG